MVHLSLAHAHPAVEKGLPGVFHLLSVLFLFKSKLGYVHSVGCQKKEISALCITLAFWKADHLEISRGEKHTRAGSDLSETRIVY